MNRYNNARFRVQSILVPDSNNPDMGEGELYVESWNKGQSFVMRNFPPHLMRVKYADKMVKVSGAGEYDSRLNIIIPKISLDMYQELAPGRGGRITSRGNIGAEAFRNWDEWLVQSARARGSYLALDRVIGINPEEWGQLPLLETTGPITAMRHPGKNVSGHKLPSKGKDYA